MTIQKERLVTLSDGTCMNDILYVIHTDAPVLVLKELEMLSCKAYKKSVRVITKRTQCFAVSLFIIHRRATCFSALSFAYSGERAKLSFRNSNREPNNHDLLCSIIL